ncbi:MAG: hypothetical protein MUO21_01840, partial [Nitrososphaeraceae archaeon]|nr:hypothetical protein [Nitrososphaeraceae archaeon]
MINFIITFNNKMALRISETGIRSGEIIVGAPTSKQCRGTIMIVRGFYPPLKLSIDNLSSETIRDKFNNYEFFRSLSQVDRLTWLNDNAHSNPDLYIDDVSGLYIKFLNISGDFMLKALTQEQITMLLLGNPNDPDGFWLLSDVYNIFPRKPNSKARRHTLIFRPNNWCLAENRRVDLTPYTGLAINLEDGKLISGTFNNDIIVINSKLAILSNKEATVLTYNYLEGLCRELGLDIDTMRLIYDLISWFTPSLLKSLIQKILRTRCTHVEFVKIEYNAREVYATAFSMLMVHPGAFVPNIQRFVSGAESALKRLAVAIYEDAYLKDATILTSLLAGAWVAQNNKLTPSSNLLKLWINAGLSALEEPYMFDYDWHSIEDNIEVIKYNNLWVNYLLLKEIRSFDSDIKMLASVAQ